MKSYSFLFWAYNVIWGGIAVFLLAMILRMKRIDQRLTRMERDMDRLGHDD